YDFGQPGGGVVRRMSRGGVGGCDLGGSGNARPYGVYADAMHVYWVNQGGGEAAQYTDGSVVSCEQAGCCVAPEVLWTGPSPTGITGDADAIYFVMSTTGAIMKIAKP
ncbi:MAG: hypothetical protein JWP87_5811, partial [Labilithrix sp.]|nr:hypothetical protein [Labilithrix sp.]